MQTGRPAPPRCRAASSSRGLAPPSRADRAVGGGRGAACERRGERGRGGHQQRRRSGGRSRRRAGVGPRAAFSRGHDPLPQGALRQRPGCSGPSCPPGETPTLEPGGHPRGGALLGPGWAIRLCQEPRSSGRSVRKGQVYCHTRDQAMVVSIRPGKGSWGHTQPSDQQARPWVLGLAHCC